MQIQISETIAKVKKCLNLTGEKFSQKLQKLH
jgi:hypothetical protein